MFDFEWVERSRTSNGGADGVRISRARSGRGSQAQTTIRLGVDVMKTCRFLIGDRVLIGFASDGGRKYMAVRRDMTGRGYTISNPGGRKVHGTSNASGIVKTKALPVDVCQVPLENCLVDDAGVLIVPVGDV